MRNHFSKPQFTLISSRWVTQIHFWWTMIVNQNLEALQTNQQNVSMIHRSSNTSFRSVTVDRDKIKIGMIFYTKYIDFIICIEMGCYQDHNQLRYPQITRLVDNRVLRYTPTERHCWTWVWVWLFCDMLDRCSDSNINHIPQMNICDNHSYDELNTQ